MNDIIFSPKAMRAVLMMAASCKEFSRTKISPNQRFLMDRIRDGKTMGCGEFERGLPEPEKDLLFGDLFDFCRSGGAGKISSEAVWRYFGGNRHIAKSKKDLLGDIKEGKLPAEFFDRMLVAHTLLPIKVRKSGDSYAGEYSNGKVRVVIKGLRNSMGSGNIAEDSFILAHFAVIADADPSPDLVEHLLSEQAGDDDFMDACLGVGNIDYDVLRFGAYNSCNV